MNAWDTHVYGDDRLDGCARNLVFLVVLIAEHLTFFGRSHPEAQLAQSVEKG